MKEMSGFVAELEEELRSKTNQVERLKRQLGEGGSPNAISGDDVDAAQSHLEVVHALRDELHAVELKR